MAAPSTGTSSRRPRRRRGTCDTGEASPDCRYCRRSPFPARRCFNPRRDPRRAARRRLAARASPPKRFFAPCGEHQVGTSAAGSQDRRVGVLWRGVSRPRPLAGSSRRAETPEARRREPGPTVRPAARGPQARARPSPECRHGPRRRPARRARGFLDGLHRRRDTRHASGERTTESRRGRRHRPGRSAGHSPPCTARTSSIAMSRRRTRCAPTMVAGLS